jgi:CRP-like cAMP-binding protein
MEELGALMQGFGVVLTPTNIGLMFVGIILGVLIGVLPGLGGANGVAILLPLTFSMSPTSAIVMLSCLYWGALFEERPVPEGEDVIAFGAPADGFYVLKSGSAVVHRRGATLAHLQPGDVFGEDALVLGAVRNASVTMTTDGRVLSLPTSALPAILADGIVRAVATPGTGRVVDVASYEARGAMPDGSALPLGGLRDALDRLDPAEPCYLTGGRAEERVLAAFILTSRGFDAWCVEPAEPISRATR